MQRKMSCKIEDYQVEHYQRSKLSGRLLLLEKDLEIHEVEKMARMTVEIHRRGENGKRRKEKKRH